MRVASPLTKALVATVTVAVFAECETAADGWFTRRGRAHEDLSDLPAAAQQRAHAIIPISADQSGRECPPTQKHLVCPGSSLETPAHEVAEK